MSDLTSGVRNDKRLPPANGERPTVIFLHLPKTGGVTLNRVIRRNYRRRDVWRDPSEGMSEAPVVFGQLSEEKRARYRLLMGHMSFGLHELVPRPTAYFTVVREPVARVVSGYRYIRRTPQHLHYDAARDMSLERMVRSGRWPAADNQQSRAIANDWSTPFGQCGQETLAAATRNLEERFVVVGLTERFDETLILLERAFGWRKLQYVALNTAPKRRVDLDRDAARAIEELNSLDRELYASVRARFEGALSAIDWRANLAAFERRNRLYRPWGTAVEAVPRKAYADLRQLLAQSLRGPQGRHPATVARPGRDNTSPDEPSTHANTGRGS
jgi:hypothetical protein